ncbi:putative ammonium transporter 3 [Ornithodoros turicata]|uniref:putative ammonium transporter 3 n=1 Tax=Ornithodoros turicata TaxID=34597 RepID=UPI003139EB9C
MNTVEQTTPLTNSTVPVDAEFTYDDATWVLTAAIVIFTMQTGFGLLESGCVSQKNEVNIMMKNAADVIFGGLTYWMFGFGLQYGIPNTNYTTSNPFCGFGRFLVDAEPEDMGEVFSTFIFQLSFSTTATTIVSGAMAERTDYNAYCIFSLLNTIVYCIPAGWVWGDHGFLKHMGALDFAGSGCVHLLGGASALVAAMLLGPRDGRYDTSEKPPMSSPTNVMLGTFTLWWGWLVFNCGSSFGVRHEKWKYASRAAVTTVNASLGGGAVGVFYSYFTSRKFYVDDIVNAILAALVAVTGTLVHAISAIVVGATGALFACWVPMAMDYFHIDDPVGAVSVHAVGGLWGLLAVGIFIDADHLLKMSRGHKGILKGGGFYLLWVQFLTSVCITTWSVVVTYILLKSINYVVPIRMSLVEEKLGADLVEHSLKYSTYDYDAIIEDFRRKGALVPPVSEDITHRGAWDDYILAKYLGKGMAQSDAQLRLNPKTYFNNYVGVEDKMLYWRRCVIL